MHMANRSASEKSRVGRYIASRFTNAVILLQAAMLLTLWVTPTWTPPRVAFIELIWAWMHQPTFYPFTALIIGGPLLTILASCCRGMHRLWLALSWTAFALIIMSQFNDRVMAMARVLWWQVSS